LRFDNIALGALLAALNHGWELRDRSTAWKRSTWCLAGVLFAAVCLFYELNLHSPPTWFRVVLYPSLTGLSAAVLITALYAAPPRLNPRLSAVILFVSLTSYSLYLWHLLVMDWMIDGGFPRGTLLWLLFFAGSGLVGWALYHLIEKPFMKLRDQLPI